MTKSKQIQLVCFDLGGVLVRICESWAAGCAAAGLQVRGDSAGDRAGKARHELTELLGTGRIDEDEWAERLARAMAPHYTPREIKRIHHAWTRTEYSGVRELIAELHAASVETACLSNTNHAHWVRLVHRDADQELAGDPEYPSVRALKRHFASHLLGLAKPDPEIYRAVERATGMDPKSILFFDDLSVNVEAARARAWRAERVDPTSETVPQIRGILRVHGVL